MNTANLQLEGLIMAVAAISRQLVQKGVLSSDELDRTLATVEATLSGDDRSMEELSPANRDAIAFPVRLLREANRTGIEAGFHALTRTVGQEKGRYNDQQ